MPPDRLCNNMGAEGIACSTNSIFACRDSASERLSLVVGSCFVEASELAATIGDSLAEAEVGKGLSPLVLAVAACSGALLSDKCASESRLRFALI